MSERLHCPSCGSFLRQPKQGPYPASLRQAHREIAALRSRNVALEVALGQQSRHALRLAESRFVSRGPSDGRTA